MLAMFFTFYCVMLIVYSVRFRLDLTTFKKLSNLHTKTLFPFYSS